jgi:hypothetical protein
MVLFRVICYLEWQHHTAPCSIHVLPPVSTILHTHHDAHAHAHAYTHTCSRRLYQIKCLWGVFWDSQQWVFWKPQQPHTILFPKSSDTTFLFKAYWILSQFATDRVVPRHCLRRIDYIFWTQFFDRINYQFSFSWYYHNIKFWILCCSEDWYIKWLISAWNDVFV